MSYDEAHQIISWAVAAIVGLPTLYVAWDWWSHRGDALVKIKPRSR